MPPTVTGPVELNEPPLAFTPFTVSKSCSELNDQITLPVLVSYARSTPSIAPENTTPGINVTGAICAGVQPYFPRQAGFSGSAYQTFSPVVSFSANSPPAFSLRCTSDKAIYTLSSSAPMPH